MKRLEGKVAIVTGAGRGIGRTIALRFAAEGAKVAVVSLTPANVERVVADIRAAGGAALGVVCDVTDGPQITSAIDQVVAAWGQIDVLVNNAFDASSVSSSVTDLSVEQLQRQLDTGPIPYLRTMQACFPHMKGRSGASIINLGSCAAVLGMVGYAPYVMAKEAIRGLTRVAAREWASDGIRVNNLLPIADTYGQSAHAPAPPTPMARFGSAEDDIAPVALFLACDDARFLTGYSLTPDGGMLIDSAR